VVVVSILLISTSPSTWLKRAIGTDFELPKESGVPARAVFSYGRKLRPHQSFRLQRPDPTGCW
jgi:hypothetical protein